LPRREFAAWPEGYREVRGRAAFRPLFAPGWPACAALLVHAMPRPPREMETPLEKSLLVTLLLPGALAVIMLGLGLSLTLDDFRRVAKVPRAVIVAMVCQCLLLPFGCWLVVHGFHL